LDEQIRWVKRFKCCLLNIPKHKTSGSPLIDILVNNAGIIVGKLFVDHASAEIDRTLAINTLALMHLSSAVLPGMIARRRGHIVTSRLQPGSWPIPA